jgi:MFS family permease
VNTEVQREEDARSEDVRARAEDAHDRAEAAPAHVERAGSLWRQPDFLKFWLGMNVNLLGSHLGNLAYSLTAVVLLQATPMQMGLLGATHRAASFLVGPFAGVLLDRTRRRPVIIGSDLALAFVAASIPVAYYFDALRIEMLYAVQFLSGVLSMLGDVGAMAYLPSVVPRERLTRANSQLQASSSAIAIAGPSLAGVLVQTLTAPVVIVLDACSFLLSAVCTWLVRAPEPPPAPRGEGAARGAAGVWAEIVEGLGFVYGHRLLRPLAEGVALHFLFNHMVYTCFVLYAVRELQLGPAVLGLVLSALGPGFLLGALLAPRLALRYGVGRVLAWAPLVTALGTAMTPLAESMPAGAVVATLAAAHMVSAMGIQLNGVIFVSLRQSLTPHRLQGRMNASFRFVNLFAGSVGALVAGWLAGSIGLRATLALAACGLLLPFLRQLFSPLRHLREQPAEE